MTLHLEAKKLSDPNGWHRPPRAEILPPGSSLIRSLLFFGAFFGLVVAIWVKRKVTNG